MVQLNLISQARTPDSITLRVQTDPLSPTSPLVCSAQLWAVDGSVLVAKSISLYGIEQDFVATWAEECVQTFHYGDPSNLDRVVRSLKNRASFHRRAHERS